MYCGILYDVSMWCMCVCCMHTRVQVHMESLQQDNEWGSFSTNSPPCCPAVWSVSNGSLLFWLGHMTGELSRTTCLQRSGTLCPSTATGFYMPGGCHGCWDSNSGPHAVEQILSPTLQASSPCFLHFYVEVFSLQNSSYFSTSVEGISIPA